MRWSGQGVGRREFEASLIKGSSQFTSHFFSCGKEWEGGWAVYAVLNSWRIRLEKEKLLSYCFSIYLLSNLGQLFLLQWTMSLWKGNSVILTMGNPVSPIYGVVLTAWVPSLMFKQNAVLFQRELYVFVGQILWDIFMLPQAAKHDCFQTQYLQ